MKALLERSRYVLFIAVLALFAASLTALILGAIRTVNTIIALVTEANTMPHVTVSFIELMDIFLVAAVLYIFAIALYELFVEDLNLPEWLVIHNLEELKAKLSGILVLVIVIALVAWTLTARTTLFRNIRLMGANERTAYASGVSLTTTRVAAHVIAGVYAGLAGLLYTALIGGGDPTFGTHYTLIVVTALLLGGISISLGPC